MDDIKRVTRGIRQNHQTFTNFQSINLFFTQEIKDNVSSATKSMEER